MTLDYLEKEFQCPLSKYPITYPVTLDCNHVFDKKSMDEYFA